MGIGFGARCVSLEGLEQISWDSSIPYIIDDGLMIPLWDMRELAPLMQ